MSEIKNLLQSITSDNQTKAKEQFDAIIADKVSNALDARKVAVAQKRFNESKQEELDETYNPIGQFKVKKTKQKTIDVPDDDTLEEFEYDIIRSGKKVGQLEMTGVGTIYGKLHGKNLPELSSYKGKNPEQKLQSFLKSKTGARWAKNVKELSDIIGESKQEDIADLKALLKNPDPKVAKNYGGIEGYKKMIQSKIDRLMKEEIEESVELDEAMRRAERIKRSKIMKRLQPKIKRAKERAAKKKASFDMIDKRAEKQAKEILIKKWLKGKSKSDVPFAERERIEDKLKKSKKAVDKIKKKLFKVIRKQEAEKFTKKESTDIIEGFEVGDTVNIKSFSAKTNRDGVAEVKIVDITKTVSGKLYVHYKQDGKVKKMDYKIFKQKIR